jgi:hypothetical protein
VFGQGDPAQKDQMPPFPEHLRQRREGTLAILWEWLRKTAVTKAEGGSMIPVERVEWIYSALGEQCDAKCWLVGCLCDVLKQALRRPAPVILNVDLSKYSLHSLLPQDGDQPTSSDDAAILGRMEKRLSLTDDVRVIRRAMKRLVEADVCHFRFDRWADNLIVAIGQLRFDGAHAPAEPAISVETWVDRIRQYVRAINAWIDGKTLPKTVSQAKASASIIRQVYALLGEASATRIWLAASLSKTMRSIGESFRPSDEPPPDCFRG